MYVAGSAGWGGTNVQITTRLDGTHDYTAVAEMLSGLKSSPVTYEQSSLSVSGQVASSTGTPVGPSDIGIAEGLNFAMQVGQSTLHAARYAAPVIHAHLVAPIAAAALAATVKKVADELVELLKARLTLGTSANATINLYGPDGRVLKVISTESSFGRTQVTARDPHSRGPLAF